MLETEKNQFLSYPPMEEKVNDSFFSQFICFSSLVFMHKEFSDKMVCLLKNCIELWKGFDLDMVLLTYKSSFLPFEISAMIFLYLKFANFLLVWWTDS